MPKLATARALDDALLRPFRYCYSSWRDSATALRQELIELQSRWNELGLPGSCPYFPTEEELTKHKTLWDDFETLQKLKLTLIRALDMNSDGWIPNEDWEKAKVEHRKLFDMWIDSAKDAEECGDNTMSVDKAQKMWPFKLDGE
jgi:hypothetical protein